MKRMILPFFLLFSFIVCGCTPKDFFGAAGKVGQVIWDPSTQVGSNEEQPSVVTLSMYATDTVNPNPYSTPPQEEKKQEEVTLNFAAQSQEEMRQQLEDALAAMGENTPLPVEQQMTWQKCKNSNNPICSYFNFKSGDKYPVPSDDIPGTPIFEIPLFAQQAERDRCRGVLELGEYSERDSRPGPLVITTGASPMVAPDIWNNQNPEFLRAIATPVSFKILQLRDDSLFLNADHDSLSADIKKALGTTYISHDDYVLTPSQFKFIRSIELDKKTRYIAVYADFYGTDGAVWKGVVQIEPTGGRIYHLIAAFQNNQVSLQHEGMPPK
ncbi:MAG: type VI secretion system lipoprotein TssJ [Saezia sp.]